MKPQTNRLLIVDDNEMNRDMLARRLARKGYDVLVANGAHELVESVKQDGIDLVLLDVEMPEITGLDALRILRKVYSAAELPVIMVTAKNQSEDIITALDLGANDYLTKPIDFPVAVARITTQLAHKRAQEALKESEERYALAALGSNDGLWDWNIPDNEVHFSGRWKSMLGFQENEISNKPEEWFDRIHDADRARVKNEITAHQNGSTPHFESEHRMLHHDGTFRWMLSRGLAIRDRSGRPLRMAGSQTDITQAKVSDPLTGLPNRLLFIDRLNRLIKYSKRRKDHSFAVVFMDLDGFKMINDSMGHMVGDQLLIGVADRLEKCLRASDTLARLRDTYTVARLGGDEFTVILERAGSVEEIARAGGAQRAHELEVLEQHVAVVAADPAVDVHAHAQRSRPVASGRTCDQAAAGVQERVPGRGDEDVLRADDVGAVEQRGEPAQRERVVAHVVVRDHRLGGAHAAQPGDDARDLAVEVDAPVLVDREVQDRFGQGGTVAVEDLGRRAVDDDHGKQPRERVEICAQIVVGDEGGASDRQHVRRLGDRVGHRAYELPCVTAGQTSSSARSLGRSP